MAIGGGLASPKWLESGFGHPPFGHLSVGVAEPLPSRLLYIYIIIFFILFYRFYTVGDPFHNMICGNVAFDVFIKKFGLKLGAWTYLCFCLPHVANCKYVQSHGLILYLSLDLIGVASIQFFKVRSVDSMRL